MGKKNKVVKLTEKKIRYIIRAKKRGESTKRIAEDMNLSHSSVKRVWMEWTKTKMLLSIKKFGRTKKTLDEESERLILEVNKEQNLDDRRLEKIVDFQYGKHVPHNAIHNVLLDHGLANVNRNKAKRRKPWVRYEREHSLPLFIWIGTPANSMARRFVRFLMAVRGVFSRAVNSTQRRLKTAFRSSKKLWITLAGSRASVRR